MNITFLIGTLGAGGAERQVSMLARELVACGHEINLVTLFPEGMHWQAMRASGNVGLQSLFPKRATTTMGVGWQLTRASTRFATILRELSPDVVYSFLEIPNVIAYRAVASVPGVKLVWGVRNSSCNRVPLVKGALYFGRAVSKNVPLIIFNSEAGRTFYESMGYRAFDHTVIGNGVDTELFRPDRGRSKALREDWLTGGDWIAGVIGRLEPAKGHSDFVVASAIVTEKYPNARFVCIGGGGRAYVAEIRKLIADRGMDGKFHLTGQISDMRLAYNALDLILSAANKGEGFPNVIVEAMACGVPCAATPQGDSSLIVEEPSMVFESGNPEAMANMMLRSIERRTLLPCNNVRNRIARKYSLDKMVNLTAQKLTAVLNCDF